MTMRHHVHSVAFPSFAHVLSPNVSALRSQIHHHVDVLPNEIHYGLDLTPFRK